MKYGLMSAELTIEEFNLASSYGQMYRKLSTYDRIALAIAKMRKIVLLTGDGALRKAALNECVDVLGTLGILDQLYTGNFITQERYSDCLLELDKHNGNKVRLPKSEIASRLQGLKKQSI